MRQAISSILRTQGTAMQIAPVAQSCVISVAGSILRNWKQRADVLESRVRGRLA